VPEGPEIRREADALARVLVGRTLVRVEYRLAALARRGAGLAGATVLRVAPRGKAMLIEFDRGLTHYSHHQLYGAWRVLSARRDAEDGRQVRVVLGTATHLAVLYSATDVALLDTEGLARHPFLSRLGPDVLDRATTRERIARRLADPRRARATLAALLLDQTFLAGLGNYLRSDILFGAGLRHTLRAGDLDDAARARLARAIHALPRRSYRTGGVTNDPALARRLRARGRPFDAVRFLVYDREGERCWRCDATIRRAAAGGRGIFFCPRCQR
jgi:endonuclease-8